MMTTGKVYGLTPPSVISAPAPAPEPPSVPTPAPEPVPPAPVPETVVAQTAVPTIPISTDGNVGIGDSRPSEKLHVTGNVTLPQTPTEGTTPAAPISEVTEKPVDKLVNKPSAKKLVES